MKSWGDSDMTQGSIMGTMLKFAFPLMLGNLLQQFYNIADTLIVGRFIGTGALAAVGSSYTLMVFITSIFIGLCMGSSAVFSMQFGAKDFSLMKRSIFSGALLIGTITLLLNIVVLFFMDSIIEFMKIPDEIRMMTEDYLFIVFLGIVPLCIYNFCAYLLRAIGNSIGSLIFLSLSVVLNVVLDLFFILWLGWEVKGAALATFISQIFAAVGISLYLYYKYPFLRLGKKDMTFSLKSISEISSYSLLTCIQQSVMNFGILLVQGLVNSFGTAVMAAFTAAVKIDSFAYMPVQDYGNAFSTFVAQNYGAGKKERIVTGVKNSFLLVTIFAGLVSIAVFFFAPMFMSVFVPYEEFEIIEIGVGYLRVEGAFYVGIGYLFLFYGIYRAMAKPLMSVWLTVISLGLRVLLAYVLASFQSIGYWGIWWSVPIGWIVADIVGGIYYRKKVKEYFIYKE